MRKKKFIKIAAQGIFIILFIIMAFYFANIARGDETIKSIVSSYGYLGIFVLSVISGFNLIVPIPAASFLPLFLESGLNFWITILIISLGMTLADGVAYLLGDLGKKVLPTETVKKTESTLAIIHKHYRWAPLFILFVFASTAPLPNELIIIPLAFLGYPLWLIIAISFVGSIVFNLLYALGIINLFYLL